MRLDGRGVLPGWELEEEESKSERTLALGPAVCQGHGFLIIKLSLKGELGAQGRFLLSYGRVLSPIQRSQSKASVKWRFCVQRPHGMPTGTHACSL